MGALRRRFLTATGILLGLQLVGTSAALVSWRSVARAMADEQALTEWRQEVSAFGGAVREQYVHQAHSYIEGGPGHLDHYGGAEAEARRRLGRLDGLPLPEAGDRLSSLREAYDAFATGFADDAVPALQRGDLDRPSAAALHGRSEVLANEVERQVVALISELDAAQDTQRKLAAQAVTRAWWVTAVAPLLGLALVWFVTRRLAQGVLRPLEDLRGATARFAAGDTGARVATGPVSEDDEVAALSVAFNKMVGLVASAEDRRVRGERLAALGEMSASVAHELLNPLTVILGSTADPIVRAEAEHARRVVEGLLGFARPGEEAPTPLDLAAVAQRTVERFGPLADAAGVTLRVAGAGDPFLASPSAARQILDNLVRNAVEASPDGALVEVTVEKGRVLVKDRGAGIPAAVRRRLYEPFATGRADGTGLGLAVAARIARSQGGELVHEERPGGGTVAVWRLGGEDG